MKFLSKILIIFFLSLFFTFLILLFFKPILSAKSLIFPYSIHPFDIVCNYPKPWFYIKIFYCCSLFFTIFLTLNSISMLFNFKKKTKKENFSENYNLIDKNKLNLLVGINSENKSPVFIPEKGLYQNILVTGTIGSRQNKFSIISIPGTIN